MCRHLAYLGPPATLRELLIDPPHSLYRQSWAPRRQRHGVVNADGFGAGWYPAAGPTLGPARYRRAEPIWTDESFAGLARVTVSGAVLAAVRSATPGTEHGPSAAAPFAAGGWLFSHNGRLDGWPALTTGHGGTSAAGETGAGAVVRVAETLSAAELLGLEARVDSALLWALVLRRLRAGLGPGEALRDTLAVLAEAGATGRFNFLLTDGHVIAASCVGDTLSYKLSDGAIVVASEPHDDGPGWTDVPEGSVICADTEGVVVL